MTRITKLARGARRARQYDAERVSAEHHKDLPFSFFNELLDYDPLSGLLTWKEGWGRIKPGDVAGSRNSKGYVIVSVRRHQILAHRIAWMLTYGAWPEGFIDHINRDKSDNRITNLRVATQGQNQSNIAISSRNSSGFKGVSWVKARGKWVACIRVNGRNKHLGTFECRLAAAAAHDRAAKQYFGEFAVTNAELAQ